MPRSEPGRGEPVLLILMGDAENTGAGVVRAPRPDGNHSIMSAHIGEDYSTSHWPVIVKIGRGFSAEFVADRLEDLVASLRERDFGFWGGVPEQLPDHLLRAAADDARRLGTGAARSAVRVVIERPEERDVLYRIDIIGVEQPDEGDEHP